ncbi:hypothetical protein ABAC460_06995 [Asticcacaulis sp. AC460]|nr:hypothetical protein ABAC460_06995 [Asticcacaulis sp. AC460]
MCRNLFTLNLQGFALKFDLYALCFYNFCLLPRQPLHFHKRLISFCLIDLLFSKLKNVSGNPGGY